jgi:hypothetical protein
LALLSRLLSDLGAAPSAAGHVGTGAVGVSDPAIING